MSKRALDVVERRAKKRRRRSKKSADHLRLPPRCKELQREADNKYLECDYEEALKLLEKVIDISPPNFQDPWITLCRVHEELENHERSIVARIMLAKMRKNFDYWCEVATQCREYYQKFHKKVYLDQALKCYDAMIRCKPDNFNAYYDRGRLRGQLGQVKEAVDDFRKLLLYYPEHSDAVSHLFQFYLKKPEEISEPKKKGIALYEEHLRTTRVSPWGKQTTKYHSVEKSVTQLKELCSLLLKEKEWKRVLDQIDAHKEFIQKAHPIPDIDVFRAIANLHLGNLVKAEHLLEQFENLPISPRNIRAYLRFMGLAIEIARAFVEIGEAERALIRLEKLKNLIEKNKSRNSSYQIQIYSLLGAAHKLKEDSDIAAEYFLKCLGIKNIDHDKKEQVSLALADIYMSKGDHRRAFTTIQKASSSSSTVNNSNVKLVFLTRSLFMMSQQCNKHFENQEFSLFLSNSEHFIAKLLSYFNLQNLEEVKRFQSLPRVQNPPGGALSLEKFAELLQEYENLRMFIQMAQIWESKKLHEDSLHLLQICDQALKANQDVNPKDASPEYKKLYAELHFVKCGDYLALGRFDEAYKSLSFVIKFHGESIPILRIFQYVLKKKKYSPTLQRFLARQKGPHASLLTAHISFAKNTYEIVKEYEKLLKEKPDDPFLYFMIGLCHIHHAQKRTAEGDPSQKLSQAFNFFQRYQELSNCSAESYYNLGRAHHFFNHFQFAVANYKRCLAEIERTNSPDHHSLRYETAHNLSLLYEKLNQPKLAREVIMNNFVV